MKPPILIERPNGEIPGLLQVNQYLASRFGVVVAAVIDGPATRNTKDQGHRWVGTELRKGSLDTNGDVIPSDDILVGSIH
jgi:hypothetical protein